MLFCFTDSSDQFHLCAYCSKDRSITLILCDQALTTVNIIVTQSHKASMTLIFSCLTYFLFSCCQMRVLFSSASSSDSYTSFKISTYLYTRFNRHSQIRSNVSVQYYSSCKCAICPRQQSRFAQRHALSIIMLEPHNTSSLRTGSAVNSYVCGRYNVQS